MLKEWTAGIGSDAHRLGRQLRKLDYEVLGIFDANGQPLSPPVTWEDEGEVPIPLTWASLLQESTLIHNHPGGMGPSRKDLEVFVRYVVARMEIVTRHGRFALVRGETPWSATQLEQALEIWRAVNVQAQIEMRMERLALRDRGIWESAQLTDTLRQAGFIVDYKPWTSSKS